MSLVSDALKKAQREAALREAREKGLPEPLLAGAQPFRARRERRAQKLAAAAAVVALAAAGAAWLLKSSSPTGTTTERRSVEGNPGAALTPESTSAATAPTPTPAAAAADRAARVGASPAPPSYDAPAAPAASASASVGATAAAPTTAPPAAAPDLPLPSRDVSGGPAGARNPAPPPAAPRPAPQAQPGGPPRRAEEASFVRTATLADGGELRLGGIAWSETAPLAYVNGRLVGVGEMVNGCAVRGIEKESVTLSCSGAALRLRLR